MKSHQIIKGNTYVARISGKLTTVRVDNIRKVVRMGISKRDGTVYDVTNLTTGRKTTFRSAAKFRSQATVIKFKDMSTSPPPSVDPSAPVDKVRAFGPRYGKEANLADATKSKLSRQELEECYLKLSLEDYLTYVTKRGYEVQMSYQVANTYSCVVVVNGVGRAMPTWKSALHTVMMVLANEQALAEKAVSNGST